ncbi:prepilin peptidase [Candidatus Enterococcus ferrettii]|uniref:Leader peptidase (Prepilin peptidase)/N-methyltransferase n=1 Tax=Candidatus Enterococcus ferrettii TaxID=2815324 RepID=A0ABV0EKN2_9ENTE|nr:A24 family peptidase [Enterococcus sp. 665A]MBO1342734.1 prepilin peptidase [Enterococcus sp. 665A]
MQFLLFLLGTIVGSFLCLIADRLPKHQSILYPGSHCTFCGQPLRPQELIPVLSIILQDFRCAHCQHKLSLRYLFCEVFTGCLFVLFLPELSWKNGWLLFWLLSSYVLAMIDYDTFLVEGRILIFSGCSLIIGALFLGWPLHWTYPLIMIAGFYLLQKLLPNSMGSGDLWIIALWSLFLQIDELLIVLIIASGSGILFYALQRLREKVLVEIPFVPFLFFALLVLLLLKKA